MYTIVSFRNVHNGPVNGILTVFLFYSGAQIGVVLTGHLTETPEELIDELSEYLHRYVAAIHV